MEPTLLITPKRPMELSIAKTVLGIARNVIIQIAHRCVSNVIHIDSISMVHVLLTVQIMTWELLECPTM